MASGNAAPSAKVIGRSNAVTTTAWIRTSRAKTTFGSATCAAVTSGRRVAANVADADAATPLTINDHASQRITLWERRAIRVPAVDPIASPVTNAAAIVANAYVVGP